MIALLAAAALAGAPAELGGWEVLRESDPWIGCTEHDGQPWCRSVDTLEAPPERVAAVLTDIEHFPEVFERIVQARPVAGDAVHVVLDMPFPLARRDYVARFSRSREGDALLFSWASAPDLHVPRGDAVRLERAGGQWRLEPAGTGTRVSYTWHAELGGDFPSWALPRARRTQGAEVLEWLDQATR